MTSSKENLQDWEKELLAGHRWGRLKKWVPEHGWDDDIANEHITLKTLWERAKPLCEPCKDILTSILNLEICNWNLEESILDLCKSIGVKASPTLNIGHNYSLTDERWRTVWAYYVALKKWLPHKERSTGYKALLPVCDPDGVIQGHVTTMLGEPTKLKQLYVQRFCLNLEYWLGGFYPEGSPQFTAYKAAVEELEHDILECDPDSEILEWMRLDGKGWIEICHHKAFRRIDINISSIGAGEWRGGIPLKGTDGLERAKTLEKYLYPIQAWVIGSPIDAPDKLCAKIHTLLGEKDDTKIFLASLLVSLLKSQQLAAHYRAEKRYSS